jgi:hypothetical protein
MVISFTSTGEVQLKAKNGTVVLGATPRIEAFELTGPGEYDIAGIQCDGHSAGSGVLYTFRTEDLVVSFVTQLDPAVAKLDDASDAHVLVFDLKSDDDPAALKNLVKSLEPSFVVLSGAGATAEAAAALGLPAIEESSLKLTRAGLPLEGTSLLSPV